MIWFKAQSLILITLVLVKCQEEGEGGDGDGDSSDSSDTGGGGGEDAEEIINDVLDCGRMRGTVQTQFRIVGGGVALEGNYPWQVLIYKNGRPICGGTVLDWNDLLTAAHCVPTRRSEYSQYRILAGTQLKYNNYAVGTTHRISQVARHPQYNSRTMVANVAIIQVEPSFNFSRGIGNGIGVIAPICKANRSTIVYPNTPAIISGYGYAGTARSQLYLRAARVRVLDHSYCERAYARMYVYDRNSMLCAGNLNGGVDACYGDGGGPLAVLINNRVTQIGIISHGYGCGRRGFPRIFMKVSAFTGWFETQLIEGRKARLRSASFKSLNKKTATNKKAKSKAKDAAQSKKKSKRLQKATDSSVTTKSTKDTKTAKIQAKDAKNVASAKVNKNNDNNNKIDPKVQKESFRQIKTKTKDEQSKSEKKTKKN